jgi:hypothetical protein
VPVSDLLAGVPTDMIAAYHAVTRLLPAQHLVRLGKRDDLPGAVIRHFPQRRSAYLWVTITIRACDIPDAARQEFDVDRLQGLIRNDGKFLVRVEDSRGIRTHEVWSGMTWSPAKAFHHADQRVRRMVLLALENLYWVHNYCEPPELEPIATADPPSPEEMREQKRIAEEISAEVAKEKALGGRGPSIRLVDPYRSARRRPGGTRRRRVRPE